MMKAMLRHAAVVIGAVLTATTAQAQAVDPGFRSTKMARSDDRSSGGIDIGFNTRFIAQYPANFPPGYEEYFRADTHTIVINNNGYLGFVNAVTPSKTAGIGTAYSGSPILAPFFADINTLDPASGVTSYGAGTYNGRKAFGVTWDGVAYYKFDGGVDKTNSFQVILVERSDTGFGNFDFYFNYDRIAWETGDYDGGVDGLGGNSATVGYNLAVPVPNLSPANPTTINEFAGSRTPGSFIDGAARSLVAGTNNGKPGQYRYGYRGGSVMALVPEPATWAMLILGFAAVGGAMRRRKIASPVAA